MTSRHIRVALLVWKPLNPDAPGDVTCGMPQVLLTRSDTTPWQVPSVVLRPGELVICATERAAYALGLDLTPQHRVLATSLRHPESMTLVVDGGWVSGTDARVAAGELGPCRCHPGSHRRRWAAWSELDDVMIRALRAAVIIQPLKETRR
ncbi:hypothetical protein [Streptomyces zagrosensis]|uniref:Uncharacterized protein n=1 Tax=Streptomyces zagrosensis TaxID=1042984 RepID=A0A7W9Q4U0_9ACTN|nr:hypothetical protein [Streptomyces zagrosensis]MBB5933638.1 hypothetical protein [Streptomyces zagrosensis]